MIRYHSGRARDAALRRRLRDLANARRRFGCRRLFVLPRREGERRGSIGSTGFTARKGSPFASGGLAARPWEPVPRSWWRPSRNARWSLDFVHDQFANGRRFRILNIVDDVTKECLGAIPETSISGRRVARELTAIIERRGKPGMIVSDHGTEFTCNAMFAWCKDAAIDWRSSHRASRCRTASSNNGRMLDELLNETLFFDLDDARAKVAVWVADYNLQRPTHH